MQFSRRVYLGIAAFVLAFTVNPSFVNADADGDREHAAKELASQIKQAGLHRVYVADFLNPAGEREFGGCYFASIFSTKIANHAKDLSVLNRIEAQKMLAALGILVQSSVRSSDGAARLARALNVDGLLLGTVAVAKGQLKITLSVWDLASNKQLLVTEFNESLQSGITGNWPPNGEPGEDPIFFAGLDGVSMPMPIYHPNPSYPEGASSAHFQGVVITGVLITAEGKVQEVRVIHDPKNGLAASCIEVIKNWRFKPAKDANGNPVQVFVPVEVSFRIN